VVYDPLPRFHLIHGERITATADRDLSSFYLGDSL
jgi:hypothetical protein